MKLSRLTAIKAIYVHADGESPEEQALESILEKAGANNLTQRRGSQLFGRNTYPTNKPEPHGYEYYVTVDQTQGLATENTIRTIPDGLYAVQDAVSLCNIAEGWQKLFDWVENSGYKPVGVIKGEHGWVNSAFEEIVNWQEGKMPSEWIFRLWVQLKE